MAHPVTAPAMQRAQRLLDQRVAPRVLSGAVPFTVEATDESFDPVPHDVAVAAPRAPFTIGAKWGRPWHTRWFRLTATVPAHLSGRDLVAHVDLGFTGRGDGFQVEGMAWIAGRRVHAVQPDRRTVALGTGREGDTIEVWVEAAATPIIAGHEHGYGPTPMGDPTTAPEAPIYTLRTAHLAAREAEVAALATELHAVIDLALDLDEHSAQRARCFAALERCAAALDVADVAGTAADARAALAPVLSVGNGPGAHRIVAVGHAHLDTAWLWPIRETRRKAVRTFANAVDLLRRNPSMVYCHSQAQHYAWVEADAPELFAEVRALVAEGRWEPVGGMWVETDLNLPSGESLLRQFVQGQRAFGEWFGVKCDGAFLPDDFGYPGGAPQVFALGGCRWFFTQKLSWNETNAMPHHSFWWEGIDGTRVFAHFSPVDTYNAIMTPSQLRFAERNFRDHAGASSSLALYGHGDGGGGPTQQMVERIALAADLEGVPRTAPGRVADFCADAMREYGEAAPTWSGEMYFEKHRGTYSTQVGTKQGNRDCERILHEVEVWSAAAGTRPGAVDQLWRRVLTQQFHDIIPGSSIAWVHRDAEAEFAAVRGDAELIVDAALSELLGEGDVTVVANPAPVARRGVVAVDGAPAWVDAPAFGTGLPAALPVDVAPVEVIEGDLGWTLANGLVAVSVSRDGMVDVLTNGDRNLVEDAPARFVLLPDTPAEYDAWDVDRADADAPAIVLAATSATVTATGPLRATVECTYRTGESTVVAQFSLDAGARAIDVDVDVDWHESERRLQWILPTALRSPFATCGTQFGHVVRARHSNTSWDVARFEVCAHRWVGVAEPGFGAAILADGPRGYDVRGDALRITVLRAPRFPDPFADRGRRRLSWSVALFDGDPVSAGVETDAALAAHPPRPVRAAGMPPGGSLVDAVLEVPGALVSAVKPADDGSGDLVVRIWETRGARTRGILRTSRATATTCDALETPLAPAVDVVDAAVPIVLRPFQILTVRLGA